MLRAINQLTLIHMRQKVQRQNTNFDAINENTGRSYVIIITSIGSKSVNRLLLCLAASFRTVTYCINWIFEMPSVIVIVNIIESGGVLVLPVTSHAEDWVFKPGLRQAIQATKLWLVEALIRASIVIRVHSGLGMHLFMLQRYSCTGRTVAETHKKRRSVPRPLAC